MVQLLVDSIVNRQTGSWGCCQSIYPFRYHSQRITGERQLGKFFDLTIQQKQHGKVSDMSSAPCAKEIYEDRSELMRKLLNGKVLKWGLLTVKLRSS